MTRVSTYRMLYEELMDMANVKTLVWATVTGLEIELGGMYQTSVAHNRLKVSWDPRCKGVFFQMFGVLFEPLDQVLWKGRLFTLLYRRTFTPGAPCWLAIEMVPEAVEPLYLLESELGVIPK